MEKLKRFINKIPSLTYGNKFSTYAGFSLCCLLALFSMCTEFVGIRIAGVYLSLYRISALISLVFFILYNRKFFDRIRETGLKRLMILFFFWGIVSVIQIPFMKDLSGGIKSLLVFLCGVFSYVFIYTFIDDKKKLKYVFASAVVGIAVIYVLCLIEIFGGIYFENASYAVIAKWETNVFGLYVPLIYGNPNNTNFFAFICFFLIFFTCMQFKNKALRGVFIFLMLLSAFILVCSDSRGGMYALLISSVAILASFIPYKWYKFFKKYLFIPLLIIAVVGVVVFLNINTRRLFDQVRINLYSNSIYTMFSRSYGLGVGLGQARHYLSFFSDTGGIIDVHNFFVEIFMSSGIVVFTILLFGFVKLIDKFLVRYYENGTIDSSSGISSLIMAIGMLSFVIISFSPSSFFEFDCMWFAVGLLAVYSDYFIFGKENDYHVEKI